MSEYLQIFTPPNAFTVAILNVLAELHQEADLKLNLKFEIEVLCKTLNVELRVSVRFFGWFVSTGELAVV